MKKHIFFVGAYSQYLGELAGHGEGISRCSVDSSSGELGLPICVAECINPSYLVWGTNKKLIYTVREVVSKSHPALLAFERTLNNRLLPLSGREVGGELPCHLAIDSTGHYLASAQYMNGTVNLFHLKIDGRFSDEMTTIRNMGSGPNSARQAGPHAHFVRFLPSPNELVYVDLGLDMVFSYPFDPVSGTLDEGAVTKTQLPPGIGPRHLVSTKNGRLVVVYGEMQERLFLFRRSQESWELQAEVPAFDPPSEGDASGAAIRMSPDQKFIYASSRMTSEIVCFALDREAMSLTFVQRIPSGGDGPRDFSISPDGEMLVAANQDSNLLTSFRIDGQSGRLTSTGHSVQVASPVCILF